MYVKAVRDTLLVLFLVTIVLTSIGWLPASKENQVPYRLMEIYNPALRRLTSVDQAISWLGNSAAANKIIAP